MSRHATTQARHHNGKMSSVTDELAELKDTVSSGIHDSAEHGKRVARAANTAALTAAADLRDSASRTRDLVGESISARPFTSVAVAAGVGALLGAGFIMMWRRR